MFRRIIMAGVGLWSGLAAQETTEVTPVAGSTITRSGLDASSMGAIVLIKTYDGTATGFVTRLRGVDFVVTNMHVLGDNAELDMQLLNGERLAPGPIFSAIGSDIAIVRIERRDTNLKIVEDVGESLSIGREVLVVGNQEGGGVATQIRGRIKGVGPDRIEVDAQFAPGNSGSPIFDAKSGVVIGVATYSMTKSNNLDDTTPTQSKTVQSTPDTRWFGFRIDNVSNWQAIDPARWARQKAMLKSFAEHSSDYADVLNMKFEAAKSQPRLRLAIESFESKITQGWRGNHTLGSDVRNLMAQLRVISEQEVNDLRKQDFYDYFKTCKYWRDSVEAQAAYRDSINVALKQYESNAEAYMAKFR